MNLGSNFEKIRKRHGHSQDQVAFELGMSQNNYSKYERDITRPTFDFIEKFATLYKMDPLEVIAYRENFVLNNNNQQGGNAASLIIQEKDEKLLEAKNETIAAKDELIKNLNAELATRDETIKNLSAEIENLKKSH